MRKIEKDWVNSTIICSVSVDPEWYEKLSYLHDFHYTWEFLISNIWNNYERRAFVEVVYPLHKHFLTQKYKQIESEYRILQSNYEELLWTCENCIELKANYTSLQESYENLQSEFDELNANYTSLSENYRKLQESYGDLQYEFDELSANYTLSLIHI